MLKASVALAGMTLAAGLPTSIEVISRLVGWKSSVPSSNGWREQRLGELHQAAHRIVGEMRIGGMALPAVTVIVPDSEPRRPILTMSPSCRGLVGSPTIAASQLSPLAAAQSSSFAVPLIEGPSSSPVIRSETEPLQRAVLFEMARHRRDEAGDAALHVDCAAAVELAVCDLRREGRMRPGRLVARRHDVGVAGKHQMRPVADERA